MAAPVPNQIWTESFTSGAPGWPLVLSPPSPLKVNDLVVLCIGHEEGAAELSITINGVAMTEVFTTPGAQQARSAVWWGIAKLGTPTIEIDGSGSFPTNSIGIQGFTFRGDYNSATPVEVFAQNDSGLASVTTVSTGTTPITTTANALAIAILNVWTPSAGDTYGINNGFGSVVTFKFTTRQHLSTAQLVLGATQTLQADWNWSNARAASAGMIAIPEGTPALDASGEIEAAVTLGLGTPPPSANIPTVNPASLAPKANLANVVQFNWGRGSEAECYSTVRGYTDWSSDVGIGSNNYISLPAMEVKNFRIHGGTQATPVAIRLPVDLPPMNTIARAFKHAPVRVRIGQCDPDNPIETFREIFIGEITRVNRGRAGRAGVVQLDVSSYKERLNIPLGIVANTTCAWNFGDKNCCIPLGPFPIIDEPLRRFMLVTEGGYISTGGNVFELRDEPINNLQLFDGNGDVIRNQTVWTDDSRGIHDLAVDPVTGDYIAITQGLIPEEPEITYYEGITGNRRWQRAILGRNEQAVIFIAGTDDFIVSSAFGFVTRRSRETGFESWDVQLPTLASSLEFLAALAFDGTDLFGAAHNNTNGEPGLFQIDISDGSIINEYDDAAITDNTQWDAIIVEGTGIYVGGLDISAPTDINLGKWTKGVTASADWLVQISSINHDVTGIGFYNGSLWVVGPSDNSDPFENLYEINPATGAVLNMWHVGAAGNFRFIGIEIDQANGDAYLTLNDFGSKVIVVNLSAPTTVLLDVTDGKGPAEPPVRLQLVPAELGERRVREIAAIQNQLITFTLPLNDPKGTGTRYRRGFVERDALRIMIKDQTSLTQVNLNMVPPPEWVVGTLVTVTPGCDKTIVTCRAEWDNEKKTAPVGFGIPRRNPVFESS